MKRSDDLEKTCITDELLEQFKRVYLYTTPTTGGTTPTPSYPSTVPGIAIRPSVVPTIVETRKTKTIETKIRVGKDLPPYEAAEIVRKAAVKKLARELLSTPCLSVSKVPKSNKGSTTDVYTIKIEVTIDE